MSSQNTTVSDAPPGKYQTLPEPCGSIDSKTLHALLPSSQDYAGTASLTYDPDRRAGCQWNGSLPGGTRYLSVDFQRVVSYDPTVSDDDKAAQQYVQMALAAHIPGVQPSDSTSPSASTSASASATTSRPPSPSPSRSGSASPSPSASATAGDNPSDDPGDASPRRVGGIGDAAYLDDALTTMGASVHRDVTVVFRIANVLVTVEFSQWSTDKTVIPPSADLQLGAFGVAQELARNFNS